MKIITLYIEDADGQQDKVTGFHVDFGDGSASWFAGKQIDDIGIRKLVADIVTTALPLPKFVLKPGTFPTPSPSSFINADVIAK